MSDARRYFANIYYVAPDSEENTCSTIAPDVQNNYLIHNIGRTTVFVKLLYNPHFALPLPRATPELRVLPGEIKFIRISGYSSRFTALNVCNRTNVRAIVHCASGDGTYEPVSEVKDGPTDEEMKNKVIQTACTLGLRLIPVVGSTISDIVMLFWPDNRPNAWYEVFNKVATLVDTIILHPIKDILTVSIRRCEKKIKRLRALLNESQSNPHYVNAHYMHIARGLIDLKQNFAFKSDMPGYKNINMLMLPLYSNTILMTLQFYVISIQQAHRLGLDQVSVNQIRQYASQLIHGNDAPGNYIRDMYKDRVDNAYNTTPPEDLFDSMMSIRTFIAVHGLEYIPIWESLYANQTPYGYYNDAISYSTLFGRQTANIIKEAIFENQREPLTPSLIGGRRNTLRDLDVYIWRTCPQAPPKIGGITLYFSNNQHYLMGTKTDVAKRVPFNGAILMKLKASGKGAVDFLSFHFSDGRVIDVGQREADTENTVFQMNDHHIASMYLSSDCFALSGQAANICVSYQLTIASPSEE